MNLSSLGADAGVSHNTAKAWLSVHEASFLYGGDSEQRRSHAAVVPWSKVADVDWKV